MKNIKTINNNCVIEQKSNINTTKETENNKNTKLNYINNTVILPSKDKTNKNCKFKAINLLKRTYNLSPFLL